MRTKEQPLINKFENALEYLRIARNQLQEIATGNYGLICNDAAGFAGDISEIISCDHGEAGLEVVVEKLR